MVRQRILKPHRIIPSELYVKRDADRQLQSIIEDMASPGYVLVSRQMGKTNLLLNAKRSYQTVNDVYTYIDLSNSFGSDIDCFRYIIDKSLDTHQNLLSQLKVEISDIRKEKLPPHLEHLQELRLILNHISGKMVVILDEIDALTRATFSDKIFSQIRSIYFERDSYHELDRLTYILSGVVEPTEIIKNPKISPFNIGQKIFLDDFSNEEHEHFLEKAKLHFSPDVSHRIFYWTSGNPRMTYDICSEAELKIDEPEFGAATIDLIVKNLYLTNYDKPPVDHIRELVANDKLIRDALLLIRYGNGVKIEDNIKTKLYLAGIISSDFSSKHLGVKNKIIEHSLSESWIRTIEKQAGKADDIILEFTKSKNYKRVVDFYMSIKEDELSELDDHARFNVGISYYKLGEFSKAADLLNSVSYDIDYERSYYLESRLLLAESYNNDNHTKTAIEIYEEIINADKKGRYYILAILALAHIYIDFENGKHRQKALEYLETIVREATNNTTVIDSQPELLTSAHLYYGKLLIKQGRHKEGDEELDKALHFAKEGAKPAIMLAKINFVFDGPGSKKVLNEILDMIIETKLTPDIVTDSYVYFSPRVLYEVLEKIYNHLKGRFEEMCDYLIQEYSKISSDQFLEEFYKLGFIAISRQNIPLAIAIFENLILWPKANQVDEDVLYGAYKVIFSGQNTSRNTGNITRKFYEFLTTHPKFVLNALELDILISYADQEISRRDFTKSQEILSFLSRSLDKTSADLQTSRYLIEFMEIKALNIVSYNDAARDRSRQLLQHINKLTNEEILKNPILTSSLPLMKNSLLSLSHIGAPIPRPLSGLNDNDRVTVQYVNGRLIKDIKYKKVKKDITSGLCRVLN